MWTFLKTLWQSPRPSKSASACMALYEAVMHRDLEGARIALENGADPNQKLAIDEGGQVLFEVDVPSTVLRSPLHVAIDHGDQRAVNLLLHHGAQVDASDLSLAVRRLSERDDGSIGPRGLLLLGMAQQQALDFAQPVTRSHPPLTLADLIRRKQPALATALGLACPA